MGRPRKPSHLKLITGTADKRTANPAEPRPKVAIPPMPATLSPKAKKAWKHVSPMLFRMGILSELDALALERMCEAYATIMHCQEVLADYGDMTYESMGREGNTMRRQHPEVAILADADRRFHLYLSGFGMTPATRSKVSGAAPASDEEARLEAKYFGG